MAIGAEPVAGIYLVDNTDEALVLIIFPNAQTTRADRRLAHDIGCAT
jgi:hypothetical protein